VCLCLEWIIVGGVLGGLCVVLIVGCVAVKLAQRHRHGYRYSHLQDATLYSWPAFLWESFLFFRKVGLGAFRCSDGGTLVLCVYSMLEYSK